MKIAWSLLLTLVIALSFAPVALADDREVMEDLPQRGLLAAIGSLPSGSVALPLPVGLAPGKIPAIEGGISKDQKDTWQYHVTNNFNVPIRITVSIKQYDAALNNISTSPASFKLKPGETQGAKVAAQPVAAGCALIMESWKRQG